MSELPVPSPGPAPEPLDPTEARRRAREVQSGATRAAVLGISDGLVTNVALILGVAGASASAEFVRLAGLASLVAGAFSMAVGEYVSMAAQVELLQRLLADYRQSLRAHPERSRRELQEFIAEQGVRPATAHSASQQIALVPDRALAVYARALGLNPEELGSPWVAAVSSLLTFALGALAPLLPWFFTQGVKAAALSIAVGALFAVAIGALLAWYSARSLVWGAVRQVIVVGIASGATWLAGRLFHVAVT